MKLPFFHLAHGSVARKAMWFFHAKACERLNQGIHKTQHRGKGVCTRKNYIYCRWNVPELLTAA